MFNDAINLQREPGLQHQFLFGIGDTKIGKHILAAFGDSRLDLRFRRIVWFSSYQLFLPLLSRSASASHCRIRSISLFGVAIPVFDFFWKASQRIHDVLNLNGVDCYAGYQPIRGVTISIIRLPPKPLSGLADGSGLILLSRIKSNADLSANRRRKSSDIFLDEPTHRTGLIT